MSSPSSSGQGSRNKDESSGKSKHRRKSSSDSTSSDDEEAKKAEKKKETDSSETEKDQKRHKKHQREKSVADLEEALRIKLLKRAEKRDKQKSETEKESSHRHHSSSSEKVPKSVEKAPKASEKEETSKRRRSRSPRDRKSDESRDKRHRSPEERRKHRSGQERERERRRSASPGWNRDRDRRRTHRNDHDDRDRGGRIVSRGGYDQARRQSADPVPLHLNKKVQKHCQEIQKRKQLWQKNLDQKKPMTNWNNLLAASGADEKSAEKFRKLMGIKEKEGGETADASEEVKKHDELIHNLDVQYQTARVATHMHRGVGLGFSSRSNDLAVPRQAPPPEQFTLITKE